MDQNIFQVLDELPQVLGQYNKPMIVHGRSFDGYPIKPDFEQYDLVHFTGFGSNPLYEDVCKGVDLFNQNDCDAIIAVGGGSAIDVAKCIKFFCRMDKGINYLQQEKKDTNIPLIAVPATAGTGSESTQHAVIYFDGEKQSISHPSLVPDYVFLVPELLKDLPLYQKKCAMLDALCQAIESWWSVNSTDESKAHSRKAIGAIKENWEEYIFENTDVSAEKIMWASNYAGRAINITATTAAHAMSYKITSMYGLPHGHAVAVCLPEVWEYMLEHTQDCIDNRGVEYFKSIIAEIDEMIDLSYFQGMIEKMEMSYPVAEDKEAEIEKLAKSVNPVRLKNNPVLLTTETLREMYRRIIH
mgnify:CR=1 FL=1